MEKESKYLGKKVDYPQHYDASVLFAIPRFENRKQYHIEEHPTLFSGFDVWHAYEFGFLTNYGLPVSGVLKIVYPSNNLYLVESKSLKLYLNSFNMSRFGESAQDGIKQSCKVIQKDLSALLGCDVELNYFSNSSETKTDFEDYRILEETLDLEKQVFDKFTEVKQLLVPEKSSKDNLKVGTHLLRSNCKVTHQPDWGSAFIFMKGPHLPDQCGLLKYIVSLRNENHFHEEICEMIYKRLWDIFAPEELMVACIYTRRGGIDICPVRTSKEQLLPEQLTSAQILSAKFLRQ